MNRIWDGDTSRLKRYYRIWDEDTSRLKRWIEYGMNKWADLRDE